MSRIGQRIRKRFDQYVKRLAKENVDIFGSRRLDCCDLNKKNGQERTRPGSKRKD